MNDFHFGKKPSLKIFYNPHKCKLSIHCKKSVFNFSESEPYFEIDIFGKNHRINLTSARRIHTEDFNTAVDCGVRAVYDSFFVGTKKLPLTIDTTVRIDKETESVLFESKITGDTEGSILSYHWPQPIEFNDEDPDAYTAIPMMQGSLIPSKWHNTIIVNDGRYYSHDAYMPWFGQRWNNQGYLMTTITPEDAGYDIQHIPSESTRISNVWYPSLGRMSYERICELKLYGKCDYNDFCRSYRSYIKESGKFVSLKEKTERNPLLKKRIGAVNDRLHLCGHGVEIDRRGQHDHVRRHHLFPNLRHIVLLYAHAAVAVTGIAPQTSGNLLMCDLDFLQAAPGFLCAAGKLVAQNRGISVPAGTAL